jgi:translation elongation factor EF-4
VKLPIWHRISKLEEPRNIVMLEIMNAAQIIEEIQRLPEDERGKVLDFARHQPNAETLEAMREPTDDLPRVETVEDLFKELQG